MPFSDPVVAKAWAKEYRRKTNDSARVAAWVDANRADRRRWEQEYRRRAHVRAKRRQGKERFRAVLHAAFIEHIDRDVVWTRDRGVCGICGEGACETNWHLDHVIPLACGGLHCYANVQVSHPQCNLKKGAPCESLMPS